ncbi:hypothetical protein ABI59_05330 [Acidobacteria bacterium Mor1]|nr:hypothetical protein ABI59_05330 [Acidobacteria bacterium Mor1]
MSEHDAVIAICSWLSLAGWIFFWFGPHKMCRRDLYRQELFEARDALFDYCMEREIPHSHPAYGVMRTTLNGLIHNADRTSFWTAILVAICGPKGESVYTERLSKAIDDLPDDEAREFFAACQSRIHFVVAKYMITTSVLGIAFAIVVTQWLVLRRISSMSIHALRVSVRALFVETATHVPYVDELEADAYCSAEVYSQAA